MPIPTDILAVPRPRNSIVIAYGKNKDLYAVRTRVGCRNDNGRHLPKNGPTIGHIVNGVYIPMESSDKKDVSMSEINLKDWAGIELCDKLFMDMQEELGRFYSRSDLMKLYCMAILRVCNPGIKDYELQEAYETSFLSEKYAGVPLSKNTVSRFLNNLGKAYARIIAFMQYRTSQVKADHHLLVDGTLKSDESEVNSLSDFSRKARTKGTRDISVLYAFDLEAMEPICSKCFPGNMLDLTSYKAFIKENGIHKGIIVADKGFPSSAAMEAFTSNPDLHYLNPVKRNAKLIDTHDMLSFTGILKGCEGITYRKEKCIGTDKWLYSFRDAWRAGKEEQDWLKNAKANGNYNLAVLQKKQKVFGTVVLESDLDLPAEVVYKAYAERWAIEIVMRYYKHACEFDETRVHDDYSVIGSEFIDFLSTVLTFRIIREFDKIQLLDKMTYKKAMSVLRKAKKVKAPGSEWELIRINPGQLEILQKLKLVEAPETAPKRKRGRPRKSAV